MIKHICDICAYEYKEENGDPNANIQVGTKWDELPEEWTCPICGAEKETFLSLEK